MKIVFAGTPEFASMALEAVKRSGHDIELVLTQPDRPAGRGMKMQPSAVKKSALEYGIPVEQPVSLKINGKYGEEAQRVYDKIRQIAPDVMVVVAYGLILPKEFLDIPKYGCLNIHASLLPRWRGAAPIQRAIEAGDRETGISIMQMEEGLDTGPVLLQEKIAIDKNVNAAQLHDQLAMLGGKMIASALERLDTLERGHIDLIITKSLSRFARNTVDCLDTVRLLKANGIGVYFEKENINTLTESSEFLITLFSGFAQAESESLSKNVAWGKQKSAEAGKVTFQYKKMLGYRKGADGQPEIVPEEAEIIRRIYHRYLNGCTLGKIKRELEEDGVPTAQGVERWSPSIIHNILTNEKYIGDALLQKTYVTDCINKKVKKNRGERTMYYVENSHPAIVSRDLFNQVQQEMTRRSSKRKVLQKSGKTELGKYSGKYALTELLVCGECGSPYKRATQVYRGFRQMFKFREQHIDSQFRLFIQDESH